MIGWNPSNLVNYMLRIRFVIVPIIEVLVCG